MHIFDDCCRVSFELIFRQLVLSLHHAQATSIMTTTHIQCILWTTSHDLCQQYDASHLPQIPHSVTATNVVGRTRCLDTANQTGQPTTHAPASSATPPSMTSAIATTSQPQHLTPPTASLPLHATYLLDIPSDRSSDLYTSLQPAWSCGLSLDRFAQATPTNKATHRHSVVLATWNSNQKRAPSTRRRSEISDSEV